MENDIVTLEPYYKDMFQKCLEKGLQSTDIKIINYVTTLGSNPGDNYTSTIYRNKVTYRDGSSKQNEIALIIKSMPMDKDRAILENMGLLEKEINMYTDILPKMSKLLPLIKVAPKCFGIFREPHLNIIFEDMKAQGYRVADRQTGLDERHLEIVLTKIAKFHAASMKILEQDSSIAKDYTKGIFSEDSVYDPIFQIAFKENLKQGADILGKMSGYERFSGKIMKIYNNFEKVCLEMVAPSSSDTKVLNHGDLWVNNFLFKYDEQTGKPADIVFVDYQLSFFCSPAIDLNYLFATSAQVPLLKRKLELIETYYYPSFVDELIRLGFTKIPSFADISNQIWKREMYNLISIFGILPTVSMEKEESKSNDFTQFVDEEKAARKRLVGMSSTRFVESLQYTMDYLEKTIDAVISEY